MNASAPSMLAMAKSCCSSFVAAIPRERSCLSEQFQPTARAAKRISVSAFPRRACLRGGSGSNKRAFPARAVSPGRMEGSASIFGIPTAIFSSCSRQEFGRTTSSSRQSRVASLRRRCLLPGRVACDVAMSDDLVTWTPNQRSARPNRKTDLVKREVYWEAASLPVSPLALPGCRETFWNAARRP